MTGTILGVWAHPDDEAYLSAGLMAAARRRGDRVVVITATLGEHGTHDPDRWPPARLAAHRRVEMRASLAAVGVHEHEFLGYADGECEHADGTVRLIEIMEDVRPSTIVTFGPDGMTGHPDHRAVSEWATAAWRATGYASRLWYATLTPAFHAEWGPLNDEVGLWPDDHTPPCTEAGDLAWSITLDEPLMAKKLAALRAHASQTTPLIDAVGEDTYRAWWAAEFFVAASAHSRRWTELARVHGPN
jgi:LmbE family N-acetylglucosaminyl deacetylase